MRRIDRFSKRFSRLLHVECSKCHYTFENKSQPDMRYNKYVSCSEDTHQSLQGNSKLINHSRFFFSDSFRCTINEHSTPNSCLHAFSLGKMGIFCYDQRILKVYRNISLEQKSSVTSISFFNFILLCHQEPITVAARSKAWTHRYPFPEWDSNPRSQCSRGQRRFMP
jgi:hypothetical protein